MEKTIRIEDAYKSVKIKKEIVAYVAFDGKEFKGENAEKDCEEYERVIKNRNIFNSIPQRTSSDSIEGIPETWYFPRNSEELELVLKNLSYYNSYDIVTFNGIEKRDGQFQKPTFNTWLSSIRFDGGDYRGEIKIYDLQYFKDEFEKFVNTFDK